MQEIQRRDERRTGREGEGQASKGAGRERRDMNECKSLKLQNSIGGYLTRNVLNNDLYVKKRKKEENLDLKREH